MEGTREAVEKAMQPAGNGDYEWSKFDSEAYFQHYYGEPHADDDRVIACAVAALKRAQPLGRDLDVVDIGTGPNLIPFMCALPRARRLTAWEFAESNVDWLRAELERETLRPQWQHFWATTRAAYGTGWELPGCPLAELRAKCSVSQGSVYDLPARRWEAATMFFCAESITEKLDEFRAAVEAFAKCVVPGGMLAGAFLVRSAGYEVGGRRFPVLKLTPDIIEDAFSGHADNVRAEHIGMVEQEIRSGYSGFVFLTGTAR